MNNSPLVSVVLPTYNRAKLLPRAIHSVLTQDFDDLELIVVDDGSNDETPQVLADTHDPRLRCMRFELNRGIGAGRKEGITRACGEFIAFADSDDVWLPGKLSYQVDILRRYPDLDFLFGDYQNTNVLTGASESGFRQTHSGLNRLGLRTLESDLSEIVTGFPEAILTANFIAVPTILMRAAAAAKAGEFNMALRVAADFEFCWRAALRGVKFGFTSRTLMERYKDKESVTADVTVFSTRFLLVLDACEAAARETKRDHLVKELNGARHRVWRNLIRAHAVLGQRQEAWSAFLQSLRYAPSLTACAYFAAALAGPSAIAVGKRLRRLTPATRS